MEQYGCLDRLSQSKKNPEVVSALKGDLWLTVSEWGYSVPASSDWYILKDDSENAPQEELWQNELINLWVHISRAVTLRNRTGGFTVCVSLMELVLEYWVGPRPLRKGSCKR